MFVPFPAIILILLILGTASIIVACWIPAPKIENVKNHRPKTKYPKDLFTNPVEYCADCGEVDLTGNCYPKPHADICDIIVRKNNNFKSSELFCRKHYYIAKNAYRCTCQYPYGVNWRELINKSKST